MHRLKVLIITDLFPNSEHVYQGIFISEQVKKLAKYVDCEVIIANSNMQGTKPVSNYETVIAYNKDKQIYHIHRIKYINIPKISYRFNVFSMLFSIGFCILFKRIQADLIHAHFTYPAGYVSVLLGSILRKPVILTAHGSDINQLAYGKYGQLVKKRIQYVLKKAERIIAVSHALKKRIIEMNISEKDIVKIGNGVNRELFNIIDTNIARQQLGLSLEDRVILFVGNLVEVKGLSNLIDAFAKVKNIIMNAVLIIIGEGELEKSLKMQSRDLCIDDKVRFIGQQKHTDIYMWMNACDVFCMPSKLEGYGIAIIEALSCGKPVVASNINPINENIIDKQTGILFDLGGVGELEKSLIYSLTNRWDREKIRKTTENKTWDAIAEKIYNEYIQTTKNIKKYAK